MRNLSLGLCGVVMLSFSVIDLFEEQGWDWAYHAFREWDGWSVEHGPDPKDHTPSRAPTDREKLLRSWYGKNRRPGK